MPSFVLLKQNTTSKTLSEQHEPVFGQDLTNLWHTLESEGGHAPQYNKMHLSVQYAQCAWRSQ